MLGKLLLGVLVAAVCAVTAYKVAEWSMRDLVDDLDWD